MAVSMVASKVLMRVAKKVVLWEPWMVEMTAASMVASTVASTVVE